jgi:hypothetical protein
MQLYIVDYFLHGDVVRAFLQLDKEEDVRPMLVMYHKSNSIDIKKIKKVPHNRNMVYVQYFDR